MDKSEIRNPKETGNPKSEPAGCSPGKADGRQAMLRSEALAAATAMAHKTESGQAAGREKGCVIVGHSASQWLDVPPSVCEDRGMLDQSEIENQRSAGASGVKSEMNSVHSPLSADCVPQAVAIPSRDRAKCKGCSRFKVPRMLPVRAQRAAPATGPTRVQTGFGRVQTGFERVWAGLNGSKSRRSRLRRGFRLRREAPSASDLQPRGNIPVAVLENASDALHRQDASLTLAGALPRLTACFVSLEFGI